VSELVSSGTKKEALLPQLVMQRPSLETLPPVQLPQDYSLRHFRPGDEEHWQHIIAGAFNRNLSFAAIMQADSAYRPERVLFICRDDIPVATTSAWVRILNDRPTGYIHYVGTRPEHTGHKLGMLASLAALHHMKAEGFNAAILQTDDYRLAAIKTYLRLGFHPYIMHIDQYERWQKIFAQLDPSGELLQCHKDYLAEAVKPYNVTAP